MTTKDLTLRILEKEITWEKELTCNRCNITSNLKKDFDILDYYQGKIGRFKCTKCNYTSIYSIDLIARFYFDETSKQIRFKGSIR